MAVGAIVQAAATLVLVMVTKRYADYTRELVERDVEPQVSLEIPRNLLDAPAEGTVAGRQGHLVNEGACRVSGIVVELEQGPEGVYPKRMASWPRLNRESEEMFRVHQPFQEAMLARLDVASEPMGLFIFRVSYKRTIDGRRFVRRFGFWLKRDGNDVLVERIDDEQGLAP